MAHYTLKRSDVKALAGALIEVADRYPTQFVTERDFYPLVEAFLFEPPRQLRAEFRVGGGREAIDFKVSGTTNPAFLELAVAPRVLLDVEAVLPILEDSVVDDDFEGVVDHVRRILPDKTQLSRSANAPELRKLSRQGGATKGRFLLLLDLRYHPHDHDDLREQYQEFAAQLPGPETVRVVYAHRRDAPDFYDFPVTKP